MEARLTETEIIQIVNEGRSRKLLETYTPKLNGMDPTLAAAQYLVDKALEAYQAGARGDDIITILTLAKALPKEEDGRGAEFSVPQDLSEEELVMPEDLTQVDDKTARALYSKFGARVSRVNYLLGEKEAELHGIETLAKHRHAVIKAESVASGNSAVAAETEANADGEYLNLDLRATSLRKDRYKLRALRDIFQGNVDRLSRDLTVRNDEFIRSGRGPRI